MRKTLLIVLLLGLYGYCSSQSNISLTLGYKQGYFKDLNYSPLNHNMNGWNAAIAYQRYNEAKTNIWHARLSFAPNSISTPFSETFTATYLLGDLEIGYLTKLPSKSEQLSWYVGGQVHHNNHFVLFNGLTSFTFLFANSLDAMVQVNYKIGQQHTISSQLALPLFAVLVRPPYAGFDKPLIEQANHPIKLVTEGQFTTWNEYQAVQWHNSYQYRLSGKWDFMVQHRLSLAHTKKNKQFINFYNQVSVGLAYKFQ